MKIEAVPAFVIAADPDDPLDPTLERGAESGAPAVPEEARADDE